ncbi:Site-specific recombinase XerD [Amycolatopsis arida]|uniref:Site-specific recombinase XerD n=1 Tax=Amycolatopsis arida TaxID=587909 RepID=A0A1I6B1I6_9PSEU|nr:site-specific integrase [Amycolatopsis arida]TDX83570.1 site-specific recombinase XerD [Amycolatopsis arida]SFQ74749.1 Site-specific recombinase XerD [Amycolatopsis arida]
MAWTEPHGAGWRVRYYRHDGSIGSESGYTGPDQASRRAADIEYELRNQVFQDPRKAQTTVGEWAEVWCEAHDVGEGTWAKYQSHLRNHILPKFGETPLGELSRIRIKSWVKVLRRQLSDATVADVVTLLSMILGEAAEETLISTNPCRRLGVRLTPSARRSIAAPWQVERIARRAGPTARVLVITAAYTGLRWGELAALQWHNVDLTAGTITVDEDKGALHELGGRLELGPPKTPASVRTVHLPTFLTSLLTEHATQQIGDHVFTGRNGGLLRRANFRDRVWRPAVAGDQRRGWEPLHPELTFHGLRHTHRTWLIEDGVPEVLIHERLGHRLPGIRGIYSHVTPPMIQTMLAALDRRWTHSPTPHDTAQ